MEYDNDRPVKPVYKPEILYWTALFLFYPLLNYFTFFHPYATFLVILFLVSLLLFPFYLVYGKAIIPGLGFTKKYIWLSIGIVIFFLIMLTGIWIIFSFVPLDNLPPVQLVLAKQYFTFTPATVAREGFWIMMNLIFVSTIAYLRQNFDERINVATLETENANLKLKYLRSQLNPHFFFNTLNSIYSLSLQKSDKTPEVVVKLADLMRYMIYDCDEEKIPLDKEIEFVKNYIDLEKMRYEADIRFEVEGETSGIMIEPFLFISFIENGFKHSLMNSDQDAFVYVKIKASAERITLNVINNTNLDLEYQAKRLPGTGLRNSKDLLELVYPRAYALDIIQTDTDEERTSRLRVQNAKRRLASLYPDSHTLDIILNKNSYTVSLNIYPNHVDKMHDSRRRVVSPAGDAKSYQ